jgi:hypothetical protein
VEKLGGRRNRLPHTDGELLIYVVRVIPLRYGSMPMGVRRVKEIASCGRGSVGYGIFTNP